MEYGPPPLFRQGISARIRFIFFVLVSVVLILIDGRLRTLDNFRSTIVSFTTPIVQFAKMPFEALDHSEGYFVSKVRLKNTNDELARENEQLMARLVRFKELESENGHLRALLRAQPRSNDRFVGAEIIGRVPDRFTHRIQLNVGAKQGLEPGMPVLAATGIVGQVSRVVQHQSEVTLLTDHRQRLAVKNARTGKQFIVAGTGENVLDLRFVLPESDIRVGDELVTSGLDHVFPADIPVGTVVSIDHVPGETYQSVSVRPNTNTDDLKFATVVLADMDPARELVVPDEEAKKTVRKTRP